MYINPLTHKHKVSVH